MCAEGCDPTNVTVSIDHDGVGVFELRFHTSSTAAAFSLGDVTSLIALAINCGCVDITDTNVYPYCSFWYTLDDDPTAAYLYGAIFYYKNNQWYVRVMIARQIISFVCWTDDILLGASVDCETLDEALDLPDCDSVEANETGALTITSP